MTEEKIPKNEGPEEKPEQGAPAGEASGEPLLPAQVDQAQELETLRTRVAELEKTIELYKDQLLRKAAEFENYKKRVESDYLNVTRYANESLIVELLPVIDDLTRSLKIGKARREFGAFYKGVELIYSKLMKTLEAKGVKPIEALGQEFNVDYHEALMQMPKEDVPVHTVIEEVEKGYMLNDKVIRHAKVIVAGNSEDKSRERSAGLSEDKDQTKRSDEPTGKETQ